eukprot:250209_1
MFSLVYSRPLPMKRQRMHALYYRAGLINTSNKSNKTHLPEWSDAYFAVLCTQIKQNTRHGGCIGPLSRYELESRRGRERVNHVVTHLKALFDGLNECEVLNILNVYSVSHPVQYGHAIKAISTLKNVLQSLTAQYRYSAAQKAKQSILSSLFILNEQGDLENRAFIYQLTDGKINTKLIKRIIQTRTNYDTNQSVYLYDAKFDGKYKTMQRMNPRITESITNYWTLNTVPSPHANETRITNHKVRDANGDKPRHQKHKLKGTVVQFYVDWLLTEGNELCAHLNEVVPSYSHFCKLKPVFVEINGRISYDLCKKHFNFESAFKIYKSTLDKIHKHRCSDKCDAQCSILCGCTQMNRIKLMRLNVYLD